MKSIMRFCKYHIFLLFLTAPISGYSSCFYFAPNDTLLQFSKEDQKKIEKADNQITSADDLIKGALSFEAQIKDLKSKDIEKKNSKIQGKIEGLQDKAVKNRVEASKMYTEAYNSKYETYRIYARKTFNAFKGTKDKLSTGKGYEEDAQANLKKAKGIRKEVQTYTNQRVVAFRLGEADELEKKAMENELKAYQSYVTYPNGEPGNDNKLLATNKIAVDTIKKNNFVAVDTQKVVNKNTLASDKVLPLDTVPKTIVKIQATKSDTQVVTKKITSNEIKPQNTINQTPVIKNIAPSNPRKVVSTFNANPKDSVKSKPVKQYETGKGAEVASKNNSISQNYYDSVKIDHKHIEMFKQFLAEKHLADPIKYQAGALGSVKSTMESVRSAWYSYAFEADNYYDSLNNILAKETETEIKNIEAQQQNKEITVNNISNSNLNSYTSANGSKNNKNEPANSTNKTIPEQNTIKSGSISQNTDNMEENISKSVTGNEPTEKNKSNDISNENNTARTLHGNEKSKTSDGVQNNASSNLSASNTKNKTVQNSAAGHSVEAIENVNDLDEGLVYAVQIAACRERITQKLLDSLYNGDKPVVMVSEDNWYKYSIHGFNSFKEAYNYKKHITVHGAFLVAYQNKRKIELYKAMQLSGDANYSKASVAVQQPAEYKAVNLNKLKDKLVFRVQIAASKSPISSAILKLIYTGNEEINVVREDNWHKYSIDGSPSYNESVEKRNSTGVHGAFVVAYRNGQKLKITDAIKTIK
jgi:hypothetical protein